MSLLTLYQGGGGSVGIGAAAPSRLFFYRITRGIFQKRQRRTYPFQSVALYATAAGNSNAKAASKGIVPLSSRLFGSANGVTSFAVKVVLNAIGKALASARAATSVIASLNARATEIAEGRISFKGIVPLSSRLFGSANGVTSLAVKVVLNAIGKALASARIATSVIASLNARATEIAEGRISFSKLSLVMSATTAEKANQRANFSGIVPLLGRVAEIAKGTTGLFAGILLATRSSVMSKGRIAFSHLSATLNASIAGMANSTGASPSGIVPLSYGIGFTLDPEKTSKYIILSNGSLTAKSPNLPGIETDFATTLSTAGQSNGKYYAEFTFTNYLSGWSEAGFANASFNLTNPPEAWLGQDSNSLAISPFSTGNLQIIINGTEAALYTGYTITAPFVVQMAVDLTNKLFWVNVNNTGWNGIGSGANPATGTGGLSLSASPGPLNPGPYYAGVTLAATTDNFTTNLGGSAYSYTPPNGFLSWGTVSGLARFSSRGPITFGLPLLATVAAQGRIRASAFVKAALSAHVTEQAEARAISAGKALLSAYNTAMAFGNVALPGIVVLSARIVGKAVSRAASIGTLPLTARAGTIAVSRAATSVVAPLLAHIADVAKATSLFSVTLPLTALSFGAGYSKVTIGIGNLIVGIAKSPISVYRITRSLLQKRQQSRYPFYFNTLSLFARTRGQTNLRSAPTGIVPLSARILGISKGITPLSVNTILKSIGNAITSGKASVSVVVPLLTRIVGMAKTTPPLFVSVTLFGRTAEMAKGAISNTISAILLYANTAGRAVGRIAFSKLATAFKASASGMAKNYAASSGSLHLLGRGSVKGYGQTAIGIGHLIVGAAKGPIRIYRISRGILRKKQRQTYPFQFQQIGLTAPSFFFRQRTSSYPATKKYSFAGLALFARTGGHVSLRSAPTGIVPLSARALGTAKSKFAGSFSGVLLFARGAAMASANATAAAAVKLTSHITGMTSGNAVSSGIAPLLARTLGMAKGQSGIFVGLVLYGSGLAAASGRIVFTKLAIILAAVTREIGKGNASWSGSVPLLARAGEIAKARASLIGAAVLRSRIGAISAGKSIASGIAALSAIVFEAANANKASTVGTLPLRAVVKAMAVSRSIINFGNTVGLFTVTFGMAKARSATNGIVGLHARLAEMAEGYAGSTVKVPLLARVAAAAKSRAGLFAGILLYARTGAIATTIAAMKSAVPLKAITTGISTGHAGLSGAVRFVVSTIAMAHASASSIGNLIIHARSSSTSAARATIGFVLPLIATATTTSMATGRAVFSGFVVITGSTKAAAFNSASSAHGAFLHARGIAIATATVTATYTLALRSIVTEMASAWSAAPLGKLPLVIYGKAAATSTTKFVAQLPQVALSAMTFARAAARSGFLRFVDPAFARIVSGIARFKVVGRGGPDDVSGSTD